MAINLLIINPNTTAAMTASIAAAARAVAGAGVVIEAVNPASGPASIQGPEDGAAALPGLFEIFDRMVVGTGRYDGVIIACFDDTGLEALKARVAIPVIGIGEAAFHAAMLLGGRFSVVTTLAVSVPVIQENIERYGFAGRCAAVRASGVPVLALEDDPEVATGLIRAEAARAIDEDKCDAIVLGCAGMANLAETIGAAFGVPAIDGVAAAVLLAEALARLNAPKT